MLTIKEICEKAGITLHTFQSWRRNDSILLPRPIAVDKRVIYFDDSILDRIKFIRAQLAEGKTLAEIEKILEPEHWKYVRDTMSFEASQANNEVFEGEVGIFTEKWEKGECKDEVCAALGLDPDVSGEPATFIMPAYGKLMGTVLAYVTIIANDVVYLAEMYSNIYGESEVVQSMTFPVDEYSMLLFVISKNYAQDKVLFKANMLPFFFFRGSDDIEDNNKYIQELLLIARTFNKIFEAGNGFLEVLRNLNKEP